MRPLSDCRWSHVKKEAPAPLGAGASFFHRFYTIRKNFTKNSAEMT